MLGSAHASRSPSIISLSDSDAIPDVDGTVGHPHAHRAPSVISLTDSDSIPDVNESTGHPHIHRAPSVISISDSDSIPDVDESTGHPHAHRAPSVISISDSDSIPDVDGSTGHPHAHRAPSVISLTDSTPDIDDTVDMDPPAVGLGRKRNVGSRGDSLTNPIVVEDAAIWPGDFYVCDIAQCIQLLRLPFYQQRLDTLFRGMFGIPYPSLTFKATWKIWEAPENRMLHDLYIDYGRLEQGTWELFMMQAKYPR